MNNEFRWRNQMRQLGGPVEPAHDLWPVIAERLAVETGDKPVATARHPLRWFALAATLVIAAGAALSVWHGQRTPGQTQHVAHVEPPRPAAVLAPETVPGARGALDWAIPDDPTLAAGALSLDNASAQLQDALEQRPDAVFLVGLLNRTNSMRLRLLRKSPNAG